MKREIEPLGREENMEKSRWLTLKQKAKVKEIYLKQKLRLVGMMGRCDTQTYSW